MLSDTLETCINSHVELITTIYHEAGKYMKSKNHYTPSSTQPPWWDIECDRLKTNKNNALNRFRCSNLDSDLRLFKDCRNSFKTYFRMKECDYQRKNRLELVNSMTNPGNFWKTLKKCKPINHIDDSISNDEWFQYFHNLLFDANSSEIIMMVIIMNMPM